ncbi:MAG: hypothetical protein IJ689_03685 [Alphaproteobacteria bacterium]|nr:hypothetical protein [Alphaproteobacteria bacterium]
MSDDHKKEEDYADNLMLIDKIYQSFEALEYTLGKLKLEEPLFITYMAKKSFASTVFKKLKQYRKRLSPRKYMN